MKSITVTLAGDAGHVPVYNISYKGNPATLSTPVQGVYNLFFAVTGGYSTGVTLPTGVNAYNVNISKNTPYIKIQNDLANVGIIRIGDSSVSMVNSNGYPLSKGGEWTRTGEGVEKQFSLIDIWIGVTDNSQIVHLAWT